MIDAAYDWLMEAAEQEGTTAVAGIARGRDFEAVRMDERWPLVASYLAALDGRWAARELIRRVCPPCHIHHFEVK